MKTCKDCKQSKNEVDFHKAGKYLQPNCKECGLLRKNKWRKLNIEKENASKSKWAKNNPEKRKRIYILSSSKQRTNLSDSYVKKNFHIKSEYISNEMIKIERKILKHKRKLKQQ